MEAALSDSYVKRVNLQTNWQFLCLATPTVPTGVLWQNGPLEWVHLPAQAKKNSGLLSRTDSYVDIKRGKTEH